MTEKSPNTYLAEVMEQFPNQEVSFRYNFSRIINYNVKAFYTCIGTSEQVLAFIHQLQKEWNFFTLEMKPTGRNETQVTVDYAIKYEEFDNFIENVKYRGETIHLGK